MSLLAAAAAAAAEARYVARAAPCVQDGSGHFGDTPPLRRHLHKVHFPGEVGFLLTSYWLEACKAIPFSSCEEASMPAVEDAIPAAASSATALRSPCCTSSLFSSVEQRSWSLMMVSSSQGGAWTSPGGDCTGDRRVGVLSPDVSDGPVRQVDEVHGRE